ncbi:hypothetical protein DDZ14_15630 [Maritimibacter sp. 55A14]|uniref:Hint domain-containing protein n=1 Tax=Maritimibacter sp. 55A14 TaxID=2174844 RepID=UPI000D621E67|nr:Hint domain-containing protein [Maritimibacter sp. 55A14]PWE30469.1 hypothetical protein DDZ14_15630 [Maritimibacter sp. 55A14]
MKPKTTARVGGQVSATVDAHALTGLPTGTTILTGDGALPIEFLAPGDRIVTRDGGMAVLRGIRSRKVTGRAVRVRAGTLGHGRPDTDTLLPAGQRILLRDWRAPALFGCAQALVPVDRLVDGEFLVREEDVAMTLHELVFDAPHILYADGLELASSDAHATAD